MATITAKDIQDMAQHWLGTPAGSYLGSDYGSDGQSLLQKPNDWGDAPDAFLQKLRDDVPVVQAMPAGAVNLYGVPAHPDRLDLFLEIAGQALEVQGG